VDAAMTHERGSGDRRFRPDNVGTRRLWKLRPDITILIDAITNLLCKCNVVEVTVAVHVFLCWSFVVTMRVVVGSRLKRADEFATIEGS
jgi:hypothetical protein